ncbi:AT-rich interactive domain-containing protein 2-like protein [Tanacetum coccineum]
MACSIEMANGSDLNNRLVVNDDVNVMELRGLFDEVLSFFLKEVCVYKNGFKAFPPKLGDGHEADLFRLFTAIRRVGSYETISEDNMWEFVAKECGVETGLVTSLKSVYVKYLKELDQWLSKGRFKDLKMDNVDIGLVEKFEVLCCWLDRYECKKGKCVGVEGTSGFNKNDGGVYLDEDLSPKGVKKVGYSMVNDEVNRSDVLPDNDVKKVGRSVIHDDDNGDNFRLTVKDAVVSHNIDNVEKVVNSQKRKWEEESMSFTEMLDWVANAARDPHDRAFEASQRSNKWKNYTGDKLWKQALLARRALFEELPVDSSNETNGLQV